MAARTTAKVPMLEHEGTDSEDGEQSSMGEEEQDEVLLKFYDEYIDKINKEAGDKDHAPISGSVYSYLALREFGEHTHLFQTEASTALLLGLYFVMITQVVGPVAIMVYGYYHLVPIGDQPKWGINGWYYIAGDYKHGVSNLFERILALVFIIVVNLNSIFVMDTDAKHMEKKMDLAAVFRAASGGDKKIPKPRMCWLWVGGFINAWCVLMCAFCMVPIMLLSESPVDVLFNALSLGFLYNLDDVGGDVFMLGEVWNSETLGHMFGDLAKQGHILEAIRADRKHHFTPDDLLRTAMYVMRVLFFVTPVMYIFTNMEKFEPDS